MCDNDDAKVDADSTLMIFHASDNQADLKPTQVTYSGSQCTVNSVVDCGSRFHAKVRKARDSENEFHFRERKPDAGM